MNIPWQPDTPTSYDTVEYLAASFPRLNPSRMGAVGFLFGLRPARASRCRMLELGCGQGATLLALAQLHPESEFHGIDLSARHIENSTRMAERAGLGNVRFEQRDILDVDRERDGAYDFIASHGVYSWVSTAVKEKILSICGSQLNPQGMAYVSYNTLPGWAHLRVIRDILIYHTDRYKCPQEKHAQARTLVSFLKETAPGGNEGWLGKWLAHVEGVLASAEPSYFLHEYLEDTNDPCYFHQFMERAETHGLQYVSEAMVSQTFPLNLGPHGAKVIEMLKRSVIDAEQYMDFARNTQFRATLLARKDTQLDRKLDPERLARLLYITALRPAGTGGQNLAPGVTEEFISAGGAKFSSREPLVKAALHFLADHPGEFLGLTAIREGALGILREAGMAHSATGAEALHLLSNLAGRFLAAGIAEPSTPELGAFLPVRALPAKPFCPPLSRAQAEANTPVLRNNLMSRKVSEEMKGLLPGCDGSHSTEDLFSIYEELITSGIVMRPALGTSTNLREEFAETLEKIVAEQLLWEPTPGQTHQK